MPALIWDTFRKEYLENATPVGFVSHTTVPEPGHPDVRLLDAKVKFNGQEQKISGRGNGPIAGYVDALGKNCGVGIKVRDYHQHATGAGSDAQAVSFIEAETDRRSRAVGRRHGFEHRDGFAQGGDVGRQPRGRRRIAILIARYVLYDHGRARCPPVHRLEIQPMSFFQPKAPSTYLLIGTPSVLSAAPASPASPAPISPTCRRH